jgi:steroid 5-alpha reductase family enzyme
MAAQHKVSALTCWAAYVAALMVFVGGAMALEAHAPELGPLWKGLALNAAATVTVWVFSLASGNTSVYDPYWCLAPLALGFYWKAHAPGGFWYYEPRETVALGLLWAWAVRFFVRVPWDGWTVGLAHEDWRYAQLRAQMPSEAVYWAFSLSSLHLTPTLLVHGCMLPIGRVLLQGTAAPPLGPADAAAFALALGAIAIEALADEQLAAHRRSPAALNGRRACRDGLWKFSRHPNYFGECAFWSAMLAIGAAAGALGAEPALATGSVAMWAFFRFASVPLMDERSLKRRDDYKAVMATTSALLLWPAGTRE